MFYALVEAGSEGLSYKDFRKDYGWTRGQVYQAVQELRLSLDDEHSSSTIACEPSGARQPWRYILLPGQAVGDSSESRWLSNRLDDLEQRLATMKSVCSVAARETDGRTLGGKKARILLRHIKAAEAEISYLVAA
jgi:hypothetical protein